MADTPRNVAPPGEEWRDMRPGAVAPAEAEDILRQARRNIREHRMGDAEVRVQDRRGRPLAGLPVTVELTRHAFLFGESLWPLDVMIRHGQAGTDRVRAWQQRFRQVFNAATNLCYWTERPRNDASKTEDRQGEPRLENFAATVDWTVASGMTAKGHPLFWSIPKCVPEWRPTGTGWCGSAVSTATMPCATRPATARRWAGLSRSRRRRPARSCWRQDKQRSL